MCGPFRGHFRQAVFRRYAVGPGAAPSCPDCPVGTAGRHVRNGYGCRRCRYIESGKGPFFGRGTKNAANVRAGGRRFPERPGGCPFFWAGRRCVPDYCSSGTRLNGAGGGVSMTGGIILPVLRSCLWSSGREKGEKAVGFGSVRRGRTDGDADRDRMLREEAAPVSEKESRLQGERHAFLWAGRMMYGVPSGSRERKTGCGSVERTPFFSSLLCLSF